jgi:hypothetical protein
MMAAAVSSRQQEKSDRRVLLMSRRVTWFIPNLSVFIGTRARSGACSAPDDAVVDHAMAILLLPVAPRPRRRCREAIAAIGDCRAPLSMAASIVATDARDVAGSEIRQSANANRSAKSASDRTQHFGRRMHLRRPAQWTEQQP